MGVKRLPKQASINIEDIRAFVTCMECGKTYSVQMKRPVTSKNCRCEKFSFTFTVGHIKDGIQVLVSTLDANNVTKEYSLDPSDIYIDGVDNV